MNLLESTENKITKNKNGENVPHLNVANNDYQQKSKVLYTSVPNKPFGQLLKVSPTSFVFLATFDSGFTYLEACLEVRTNWTLVVI